MSKPRNILFILTDQMRADAFGAAGNEHIRTPVLDGLCKRGVRFINAYTPSPVCVPARYALLSGRLPHNNGCFDNGSPMDANQTTMMSCLHDAGYQTHGVGKMHFSPSRNPLGFESMQLSEEIPARADSDDFLTDLIANGFGHVTEPHGVRSDYYYLPQVSQLPAERHTTAWTSDKSIEFLRERDNSRPFFLWTSFIKPIRPLTHPSLGTACTAP